MKLGKRNIWMECIDEGSEREECEGYGAQRGRIPFSKAILNPYLLVRKVASAHTRVKEQKNRVENSGYHAPTFITEACMLSLYRSHYFY